VGIGRISLWPAPSRSATRIEESTQKEADVTTPPDDEGASEDDEFVDGLEGCITGCITPVAGVVVTLVLFALAVASNRLLGFDVVGIALVCVVVLWIAVAWWRLRRTERHR